MKYLLIVLFAFPSFAFCQSAEMYTAWLIDKDRVPNKLVFEVLGKQSALKKYGITDIAETSCTRYFVIGITSITSTENNVINTAVSQGKISRLLDQWTERNSLGEIVTRRNLYPTPSGYQDYSVKQSTP